MATDKSVEYSSLFADWAQKHDGYQEALEIVRQNSSGTIWLMGGFLYRNLVSELYGTPAHQTDFDFLVEKRNDTLTLPAGWVRMQNRWANPKLVHDDKSIDLVPLDTVYSINYRGLDAHLEHYLSGTPLNIHSLVYDIAEKNIIGEAGLKSLREKKVRVNHLELAQRYAEMKRQPLNRLIEEKAQSLGFTPVYPLPVTSSDQK